MGASRGAGHGVAGYGSAGGTAMMSGSCTTLPLIFAVPPALPARLRRAPRDEEPQSVKSA